MRISDWSSDVCSSDLHTLLHFESDIAMMDVGRPNWTSWLKAAGVRGVNTRRGPTFNHVALAMQAAADGLGVVLGIPVMAREEIAEGDRKGVVSGKSVSGR